MAAENAAAAGVAARFSRLPGSAFDVDLGRDHAVVLMQGGGASCMVETGYLYPAPNSVFDMHYSIRTEKHYFAARDNATLEIMTNDRKRSVREMKLTNVFFYPEFVRDTLRRVRDGRPPIADLTDNARAVELVEAAYRWG